MGAGLSKIDDVVGRLDMTSYADEDEEEDWYPEIKAHRDEEDATRDHGKEYDAGKEEACQTVQGQH